MQHDFHLPPEYLFLGDAEARRRIRAHREARGGELQIWAHPYQRGDVAELADFVGDGVALARRAAVGPWPRELVCASVRYVAENARLLAPATTRVLSPDRAPGCPMSDSVPCADLERLESLVREHRPGVSIVPLVSVTMDVECKAWCGELGGSAVGSSNASTLLRWALSQADVVLWAPDAHLATTAARAAGLAGDEILRLGGESEPDEAALARARVVTWNGRCPILSQLQTPQVAALRAAIPGVRVWAQHDLAPAVVAAADAAGSLDDVEAWLATEPAGGTLAVASEIHAVERLAARHPDRRVVPLAVAFCASMYELSVAGLLHTLDRLATAAEVEIDARLENPARAALERMLHAAP